MTRKTANKATTRAIPYLQKISYEQQWKQATYQKSQ